jgi:spore germination protein YaaH
MNLLNKVQEKISYHFEAIAPTIEKAKRAVRVNPLTLFLLKVLGSKQNFYRAAAILDIVFIALIVFYGIKPAQRIIQPLVSAWLPQQHYADGRITKETFAFIPGSSVAKIARVNLDGITNVAFFDLPIDADGTLIRDTYSYDILKSGSANNLFDRVHAKGGKSFITLTQTNNNVIRDFLNDKAAQETAINEAISEIQDSNLDGVVLDIEFKGQAPESYKGAFTSFVTNFTNQVHKQLPDAQVTVALSSNKLNNSIYDAKALSNATDKIFILADNLAVVESENSKPINPKYGYSEKEYWDKVSGLVSTFMQTVPSDKLVLETAWYGYGENYPMYVPSTKAEEIHIPQEDIQADEETINQLVEGVPASAKDSARRNLPYIIKALREEDILNSNVLAYAMATIEHETAGTFEPIAEIKGDVSARRLGYEGGTAYYGRGFIQVTHLRNYRLIGERIGMGDALAKNPELASNPEVAARILAAFFRDNNVANKASHGSFVAARTPVNPDNNGRKVAYLAYKYIRS